MSKKWILIGLTALLGIAVLLVSLRREAGQSSAAGLIVQAGAGNRATPAGFARAERPIPLRFPADHGPHPDYLTEWWYYTGNLATGAGRRFGFQLTFFRRALAPPLAREPRPSVWAANQIYLAHFALTDVASGEYRSFERLARGSAGLAGAQASPFAVWLEGWRVEALGPDRYRLAASQGDLAIDLILEDLKGPVAHGEAGYSRKGPEPGNASYYYSLTRLESEGWLQVRGERHPVSGLTWMDHEYSTSALAPDQVGWDWFGLQLEDGSELMVFQIRRADGSADPFSAGTLISPDRQTVALGQAEFEIEGLGSWRSPRSGARYPAGWRVTVPSQGIALEIQPHLADQEFAGFITYWEGAVKVTGTRAGRPITGTGYVELTGYAQSMAGEF